MQIPMKVESDDIKHKPRWVIIDASSGATDLGLQFPCMENANLFAVEDPSFKWMILSSEIGIG